MQEFTARQMKILERLFEAGFRPIAIPPYEKALCIRRGYCSEDTAPTENAGLRLLAAPTFLIDGNLSVKVRKKGAEVFVWKKSEIAASPKRLEELEKFRGDLASILEAGPAQ